MGNQNNLRSACQRGNEKAAFAALSPSSSRPADPLFIYKDDSSNTILHYICSGQPVGSFTRLLLGWPEGVRPSPHATARAALLSRFLQSYPDCIKLACYQNENGVTPVHFCVQTASIAVLKVLLSTAQQMLGQHRAALLLSVADFRGRSALDIAFASQQWDAARLLLDTAPLSHAGLRAESRLRDRIRFSSWWQPGSIPQAPAGAGAGGVIAGAVGGVLNKLWDSWGGNRNEFTSVAQHRQHVQKVAESAGRQSMQSRQQNAAGERSQETQLQKSQNLPTSGAKVGIEREIALRESEKELMTSDGAEHPSSVSWTRNGTEMLQASTSEGGMLEKNLNSQNSQNTNFLPEVTVLGNALAVQQYRQDQIYRLCSTLGLSSGDAAAVLAKHAWDENAAVEYVAATMQGTVERVEPSMILTPGTSSSSSNPDRTISASSTAETSKNTTHGVHSNTTKASGPLFSSGSTSSNDFINGERRRVLGDSISIATDAHNNSNDAKVCLVCFEPLNDDMGATHHGGGVNFEKATNSTAIDGYNCYSNNSLISSPSGNFPPGQIASTFLSCGHVTCDACWVGILDASPHAPCCPEPTCRLPLPLPAAKQLLPPVKYTRVANLITDAYVATNPQLRWCPAIGCTTCLQLPCTDAGLAGATAAAAGRGVDAHCACGHDSCWACGQDAHEPATCAQALSWSEELAKLRAAAPVSDRRWLQRHSRQCPGCGAFIQRTGGCNHMTCSCGKHWCWECRRDWSEHNADTGGFYFCSLEVENSNNNNAEGGEGGSGGGNRDGSVSDSGPNSSWLREVWRSVHNVASQAILQRALQMHLRHECDRAAVRAVGAHVHELSSKLNSGGGASGGEVSFNRSYTGSDDSSGLSNGRKVNQNQRKKDSISMDKIRSLGPEEIGFSKAEAARMEPEEWAGCMAAACRSAAENGAFNPKNKEANLNSRTENTASKFSSNSGPSGRILEHNIHNSGSFTFLDAPKLAVVVIQAHATLQNAAAALRGLPGGPRRRYLTELCDDSERWLAQVEPVLMDLPYQDVAAARGTSHSLIFAPFVAARGALASLIQGWKGVGAPKESSRIPGLPAHVIVAQAHYLAALERQRGQVGGAADALQQAIGALKHAARSGLFATNS